MIQHFPMDSSSARVMRCAQPPRAEGLTLRAPSSRAVSRNTHLPNNATRSRASRRVLRPRGARVTARRRVLGEAETFRMGLAAQPLPPAPLLACAV